jgi:hypothetical protein
VGARTDTSGDPAESDQHVVSPVGHLAQRQVHIGTFLGQQGAAGCDIPRITLPGFSVTRERPGHLRTRPHALMVAASYYSLGRFVSPVVMKLTQSPSFTKPSCS